MVLLKFTQFQEALIKTPREIAHQLVSEDKEENIFHHPEVATPRRKPDHYLPVKDNDYGVTHVSVWHGHTKTGKKHTTFQGHQDEGDDGIPAQRIHGEHRSAHDIADKYADHLHKLYEND